jgi:ribose transport system permease protein
MALAQTFLIVSGGIDVSVGSVVAITTVTTGLLMSSGADFWVAASAAVALGGVIGAINALLVVVLNINPFISTLGTLSVFQGLAFAITGGKTIVVDDPTLSFIGIGSLFGLPLPLVVLFIAFVVAVVFERFTRWGRTVYAIGGNAEAARLSGLRVKSMRAALYVFSGLSGGVAGVLILGQLSAASPQVGSTFLLSVVTAVILGGASLAGGKGTVVGTVVAVAILGMLSNGFALLGSTSAAQQVALGVALIFAVLLEQVGRRLRRTGQ